VGTTVAPQPAHVATAQPYRNDARCAARDQPARERLCAGDRLRACAAEQRTIRAQQPIRPYLTQKDLLLDLTYVFVPPDMVMVHAEDVTEKIEGVRDAPLVTGATDNSGHVTLSEISIGGHSIEDLTIYTPSPSNASQEFVTVSMDEPSSLTVFAVYFVLGGGCLLFLGRRRVFGADSIWAGLTAGRAAGRALDERI